MRSCHHSDPNVRDHLLSPVHEKKANNAEFSLEQKQIRPSYDYRDREKFLVYLDKLTQTKIGIKILSYFVDRQVNEVPVPKLDTRINALNLVGNGRDRVWYLGLWRRSGRIWCVFRVAGRTHPATRLRSWKISRSML
jgi:hypothetical protein